MKSHSNLNQKVIFIFLCLHLLLHFQASSPSKTNITLQNGGKVWMVSCFYFQSKVGCNTVQSILMRSTQADRNIINSVQDPRKSPTFSTRTQLCLGTNTTRGSILKVRICLDFDWELSVATFWTQCQPCKRLVLLSGLKKGFTLDVITRGQSTTRSVLGHFRHGDEQSNKQPNNQVILEQACS